MRLIMTNVILLVGKCDMFQVWEGIGWTSVFIKLARVSTLGEPYSL